MFFYIFWILNVDIKHLKSGWIFYFISPNDSSNNMRQQFKYPNSQNAQQFIKVSDSLKCLTHTGELFLCISVWNGTWLWLKLKLYLFFLPFRKQCEVSARCEVQQVSHALSHFRLLFISEWRTGIPRYEWTCSAPGNVMNSWVASWSQLLSQDITSTMHSDSWLPGVGFDEAWFSCTAQAVPHLETCLLLPQSDWHEAIIGECLTIYCLSLPHSQEIKGLFDKKFSNCVFLCFFTFFVCVCMCFILSGACLGFAHNIKILLYWNSLLLLNYC